MEGVVWCWLLRFKKEFSCDDDPVGPEPADEHLFYIAPITGNLIKTFSVEQEKFIDSFYVDSLTADSSIYRLHVIGNDSLLAVSTETMTYIVDLESKEVNESFYGERVIYSRDSRYYFCKNNISRRWELRTYPEHILIYDDAPTLMLPFFSNDSKYLSATDLHNEGGTMVPMLIIYDMENDIKTAKTKYLFDQEIFIFEKYHYSSLNKTYFGGNTEFHNFLGVTDLGSDSIRVVRFLSEPWASVMPVISPDGKYVYVSEQVMEVWLGIPDGKIYVYDTETEDSIAVIEYEGISQPHSFVITEDSKYMMVDPVNEFDDETNVCLIDAQSFQVIGVFDFHDLPGSVASKRAAHGGGNFRL